MAAAGKDKDKDEKGDPSMTVSWFKLLTYADPIDWFLMFWGTIGAIGNGIALPAFTVVFADLIDKFGSASPDVSVEDELRGTVLWFVWLAIASWVCSYFEIGWWMITAERQSTRIREAYLRALLRQDVSFYDGAGDTTGTLLARTTQDVHIIQEAIGEKVGNYVHHMATFISGMAIAFFRGWKMTLVLLACVPLLGAAGWLITVVSTKTAKFSNEAYSQAGGIVEQCLGAIRTVAAFGREEYSLEQYRSRLGAAEKSGNKMAVLSGLALGITNGTMFLTYALALWYGSTLVLDGEYTGGDVMLVLFAVLIGGLEVGQAAPNMKAFGEGKTSGYRVFEIIDRVPPIDSSSEEGAKPAIAGKIEVYGVGFTYPARPDVTVMNGFDLVVEQGQTVALVGESGSGKSTVISLLQRFYDIERGSIKIDGMDIKDINLRHLRSQIGLVSQEPSLFSTTIRENIVYGKEGDVTDAEIEEACKVASAHEFISKLPQKYNTQVGERGITLSGGQKQRIAIARAVLRNPKILLLDEATSALDTESENVVQEALDKLAVGRSTIVIAHRLSTIRDADKICVVSAGQIVEQGSHNDLMKMEGGKYKQLLNASGGDADGEQHQDYEKVRLTALENRTARTLLAEAEGAEEEEDDEVAAKDIDIPASRLWAFQKPELAWLGIGVVGSIMAGITMPGFALGLSRIIAVFYETDDDKFKDGVLVWVIIFILVAFFAFVSAILQTWAFGVMGVKLTTRVRELAFASALRQDPGYFDLPANSTGAVTQRLESDAMHVRGAVADKAGVLVQNLTCMVAGYVIAFLASWECTLVITCSLPPLIIASVLQMQFVAGGFSGDNKKMYAIASQTAADAVGNIRTVSAFGIEDRMVALYHRAQLAPYNTAIKAGHVGGIAFGFSQFVMFAMYGFAFWYGGRWVDDGKGEFQDVLDVFFAILMTGFGMSQAALVFPSVGKAQQAVNSVFGLIDRVPPIDSRDKGGAILAAEGKIEFSKVEFNYPSRPKVRVMNELSFTVEPGQTVALVGESGSGKSTVISLLQRFYDILGGSIKIDGLDIKEMNINSLRANLGLVQQEPSLFATSIRENIAFGKEGATEEDIIDAAKIANAHDFIMKLPDQYNTDVGERGTQLSGGQKQRIAIARAVVRNPKILLLDEATSALDNESEKLVQAALDKVMVGRTSLVVAHRLTTIRRADKICVFDRGSIVEMGTHNELKAKENGVYASLAILQGAS